MTDQRNPPLESEVIEEANENGSQIATVGSGGAITENKGRNISPKSLANLKPFEKGVSGNPGGRPQTRFISNAYRKLLKLSDADLEHFVPETVAERIALAMIGAASDRDIAAIRELADRTEGKVPLAEEDREAIANSQDPNWLLAAFQLKK